VILYRLVAMPVALLVWRQVLLYPGLFGIRTATALLYVGISSVDTSSPSQPHFRSSSRNRSQSRVRHSSCSPC
jgi:hypothetical protein